MITLDRIRSLVWQAVAEWQGLRLADLQFWHRSEARLWLSGLLGLTLVILVIRSLWNRWSGRRGVSLPALLGSMPTSPLSIVRHTPLLLFLGGLGFFAVALSDPYTALISREVSYPGRRIGLLIDASISMRTPFTAAESSPV